MSWFRDINELLRQEPEDWLAYLHGQQLDNLSFLTTKRPRYRGLILQVAKYVAFLLRDLKFNQRPELKRPAKFFVFAGSANQIGSLNQTIDSLKKVAKEF
jgi:hypothetical protein